jgi:predicted Zn-dependent peptidase
LLGGFFGSRLMKNIREEKGYTYGIYSAWAGMRHAGLFVVQADVGLEYVEPTIAEVKKEIQRLQQEAVSEAELSLVKNYLLGYSVSQRETPFQLSELLRFSLSEDLPFAEMDRRFEVIEAVTPGELQALAQQWLRPEALVEVVAGGE